MMRSYDPMQVESERQETWKREQCFSTPKTSAARAVYLKASSPFTSGSLHLGHVRDYTLADLYARYNRTQGADVLFTFSFDAFGLPAEDAAAAHRLPTEQWVRKCGQEMILQMEGLGLSFDFERVFYTCDPEQYRWTQWLFLQLLEAGLIYREYRAVEWCGSCRTSLAASQARTGECWRCQGPVQLRSRPAWLLRASEYLEESTANLSTLTAWDEQGISTQSIILGETQGIELELEIAGGDPIVVFTPHAANVEAAEYVLLSPHHPRSRELLSSSQVGELRSGGWVRHQRSASRSEILDSGVDAIWGAHSLPIYVSPIVDGRYGPSAVFGIPAVDPMDAAFSKRLPRRHQPEKVIGLVAARKTHRFSASDFTISRQREWGTPIPIINCPICGAVPVPLEQLPVILDAAAEVPCPQCGAAALREAETLDCHFDTLLAWVSAAVPPEARQEALWDHPDLQRWLPAAQVVGGIDSAGFIFDQRLVTKALRDLGPLAFIEDGEPYRASLIHEMVLAEDGRKMSKHLDNAPDLDELLEEWGADVLRFAMIYAAGPQKAIKWDPRGLVFASRFLNQLAQMDLAAEDGTEFQLTRRQRKLSKHTEIAIERVSADLEASEPHKALRNIVKLFETVKDFKGKAQANPHPADQQAITQALVVVLQLLAPICPHLAEHLLLEAGYDLEAGQWPQADLGQK